MKKLLTVLIALSMVFSGFAAEPVASADMVDFTGEASVTWGIDLESGETGFKNETDVELILSLLPADMTNSTEGSGVWGELVVKVDGDTNLKSEADGTPLAHDFADVIVDVATIHVGDLYFGIKSGDFDYGDDFLFPNAFNYDNSDSETYNMVRNYSAETGYNQGFVAGYATDMFSIEASVRSRPSEIKNAEIETVDIYEATGSEVASPLVKYFRLYDEVEVASDDLVIGTDYYRVTYDGEGQNSSYWTDDYAAGVYAEVKPIEDLRIGAGGSFILSGETVNEWGGGDYQAFIGADYSLPLTETTSIVPAVTYNMKNDYVQGRKVDDKLEEYELVRSSITAGLAYRWGESEDAQSLLDDFYGDDALVYMKDGGDEDDTMLLPGVSLWTDLSFLTFADEPVDLDAFKIDGKTDTYLPLMLNVYSGDLNGLKLYGLFYANLAPRVKNIAMMATIAAEEAKIAAGAGDLVQAAEMQKMAEELSGYLPGNVEDMQIGFAASYNLPVGDMTITPKFGTLFNYSEITTKGIDIDNNPERVDTTMIVKPEVAVDFAGIISNTTFSLAWDGAEYHTANSVSKADKEGDPDYTGSNHGEFTVKCKIAL